MAFTVFKFHTATGRLMLAASLALLAAVSSQAQSIDPNSPTPVVSNEIAGSIAPLDIGDARSTRYFYTFNSLQGDLELTVESRNLDGDVDIFLAGNMRPLTKVTLYASASANRSTKTVYLRRAEPLILRVQARTPNDAEGTYRIRFGGAFRPAPAALAAETTAPDESTTANVSPNTAPGNRKVKRVTSVGARIEEPVVEVAKEEPAPTPAATPEPTPEAERRATPRNARTRASERRAARNETARRNRANREAADASKAEAEKPTTTDDENADAGRNKDAAARTGEGTGEKPATKTERPRPARVPRAPRGNKNTTARRTDASPAETVPTAPTETPALPASTRLVLVMRDGETFERDMASIRRVTVENGMLVIVSKNGKTERQPMTAVLRMSIEP